MIHMTSFMTSPLGSIPRVLGLTVTLTIKRKIWNQIQELKIFLALLEKEHHLEENRWENSYLFLSLSLTLTHIHSCTWKHNSSKKIFGKNLEMSFVPFSVEKSICLLCFANYICLLGFVKSKKIGVSLLLVVMAKSIKVILKTC